MKMHFNDPFLFLYLSLERVLCIYSAIYNQKQKVLINSLQAIALQKSSFNYGRNLVSIN